MRIWSVAPILAVAFATAASTPRAAFADSAPRLSGPFTFDNLALYFVHGTSVPGPAPLTLQEALMKGSAVVTETGKVNELSIENLGSEDVFIQSGDIVKGGQQDRVLTVSLILPPKSGKVPIASFCVEQGRWASRGTEDRTKFASAASAMPSREAKLAMKAPRAMASDPTQAEARRHEEVARRQQEVWASVAQTQRKLSGGVNAPVAAPQSATSLQLSLENEKVNQARGAYIAALTSAGEKEADIVGYVFAVNGKLNSGDTYPSNALFRKMWPKLLAASVTEAIGERGRASAQSAAPAVGDVAAFLKVAEQGKAQEQDLAAMRQEVRDGDKALYVEARSPKGAWFHRNYVAK
ncbi:MAG: DUF6569 family protein [Hyphomicrobiaceae bacterium]|jgi:hypothetical protein